MPESREGLAKRLIQEMLVENQFTPPELDVSNPYEGRNEPNFREEIEVMDPVPGSKLMAGNVYRVTEIFKGRRLVLLEGSGDAITSVHRQVYDRWLDEGRLKRR